MLTLTLTLDPGHGWLKVPYLLLWKYGVADKISGYSYMKGDYAYLEEDVDANVFLEAVKPFEDVQIKVKNLKGFSRIRYYSTFNKEALAQADYRLRRIERGLSTFAGGV